METKKRKYKKKSKMQRLRDKADSLWFKACLKRADDKCELTDQIFGLQSHHFFSKIAYPMLRYDLDNGVVLKKGLHFNHHHKGDPTVHQRIIEKKGNEWYQKLYEKSLIKVKNSYKNVQYYEEVIKKLEKALKD